MSAVQISPYALRPLSQTQLSDRSSITISPKSKYVDLAWDFSDLEKNPNVKPSASILRFAFEVKNAGNFSENRYDSLREAFKELIYSMASSPKGKLPSPATLKARYTNTRYFMSWAISNQILRLTDIRREDTDEFIILVRNDDAHPMTKIGRLDVLKFLWKYRKSLSEPIGYDPLMGESPQTISGVTRQQKKENRYDYIPDDLSQKLIRGCVKFVRDHGVEIAVAVQMRDTANLDQIRRGKSKANRDRTKREALRDTGLTNADVTTLTRQLLTGCYIIINFFTGIRASEMLTIGPNQIVVEDGLTWVIGRQHKLDQKPRKWMAPDVVHEAHQLAKSLTQPMREAINYEIEHTTNSELITELNSLASQLFLGWSSRREHGHKFTHAPQVSNIKGSIHSSLKEVVKLLEVKTEDGSLWALHPHQFRRSFVRFMCSNAMNIRYLQEHMGHKSLDMTAWYDSDDVELTNEIVDQMKEFKAQKLNAIFNHNQKITGAGAENIIKEREEYFIGIASVKSKDAFMQNLAEDISLRSTGHSWCMGDSGNGSCTGVVGCMMDIGMTQKCSSALITEEHLPTWLEIKKRNELLLDSPDIGRLQKEAIGRVIAETIVPIIKALTAGREVHHGD